MYFTKQGIVGRVAISLHFCKPFDRKQLEFVSAMAFNVLCYVVLAEIHQEIQPYTYR
jgi:hypothetical protein